jgi:hypothetical protein
MAENVAHKFFSVPPPNWMAPATYSHIMFGPPDAPQPGPAPPGPAPAPPRGACPKQTGLNASTVCLHSVPSPSTIIPETVLQRLSDTAEIYRTFHHFRSFLLTLIWRTGGRDELRVDSGVPNSRHPFCTR